MSLAEWMEPWADRPQRRPVLIRDRCTLEGGPHDGMYATIPQADQEYLALHVTTIEGAWRCTEHIYRRTGLVDSDGYHRLRYVGRRH